MLPNLVPASLKSLVSKGPLLAGLIAVVFCLQARSADIWWEFVGSAGDRGVYMRYQELVDFTWVSSRSSENYPFWDAPSGHPGVKYQDILVKVPADVCLELVTVPGYEFYPGTQTSYNPDTRIWYESPTGWVSASDDVEPGVYRSWVRVWSGTTQQGFKRFRFAAYNQYANNIVFEIWARIGEADGRKDCHTGSEPYKYGYITY